MRRIDRSRRKSSIVGLHEPDTTLRKNWMMLGICCALAGFIAMATYIQLRKVTEATFEPFMVLNVTAFACLALAGIAFLWMRRGTRLTLREFASALFGGFIGILWGNLGVIVIGVAITS